jgi:hypothetical protein
MSEPMNGKETGKIQGLKRARAMIVQQINSITLSDNDVSGELIIQFGNQLKDISAELSDLQN